VPGPIRCACGALNDEAFDACIRCGAPLRGAPAPAAARGPRDASATEEVEATGFALLFIGGLSTVVFLFQVLLSVRSGHGFPLFSSGGTLNALRAGALHTSLFFEEPFRVVSAIFAHYGLLHFGMNMLGLGDLVRLGGRRVGAYRVIVAFVGAGIAGFLVNVAMHHLLGLRPVATMGASGGIFGLLGLLLGVLLRRRDPAWRDFAMRAVFYAVLFGFMVNAANAGFAINNGAHLGGLAFGTVFGLAVGRRGFSESGVTRAVALAAIALSVGSLALALRSDVPDKLASAPTSGITTPASSPRPPPGNQ
jgi:membrane associated rhomboid family serine protease